MSMQKRRKKGTVEKDQSRNRRDGEEQNEQRIRAKVKEHRRRSRRGTDKKE